MPRYAGVDSQRVDRGFGMVRSLIQRIVDNVADGLFMPPAALPYAQSPSTASDSPPTAVPPISASSEIVFTIRRNRCSRWAEIRTLADFDWSWPTKCERSAIEALFSLGFIEEAVNVVLIGPNGLGKTMLLKNLAHTRPKRLYP